MSDRDASLDEASNIAFKALKEKPPAKPVDLYYFEYKFINICTKILKIHFQNVIIKLIHL